MSFAPSLTGMLSGLVSLANAAYISLIGVIWFYIVDYGLSPAYSYPTGISGNYGFMSFYHMLFGSIYLETAGIAVLAASLVFIASNSLGRIHMPASLAYRTLFGFSLSFFSFRICLLTLHFALIFFMKVWNYDSFNWYSLISVSGTVKQIHGSHDQNPFFGVMEFLLLSVYFAATGSILAILEIREAMIIFLMLTLPLFSILFVVRGMENMAIRLWKTFLELTFLPFFMLIILFSIHIFAADFALQIGFMLLAAVSPYLLVTGGSMFGSRAVSMLSGGGLFGTLSSSPASWIGNSVEKAFMSGGGSMSQSDIPEGEENTYRRF